MKRVRTLINVSRVTIFLFLIITIFIFHVDCTAARENTKIKGTFVDAITGKPMSNISVTATMRTNILEDKIYEKNTTKTNVKGEFLLQGLSHRYDYTILTNTTGYIAEEYGVSNLPRDKTFVIERPLKMCLLPSQQGIFIWETGTWKKLENNIKFKVDHKQGTYGDEPGILMSPMDIEPIDIYYRADFKKRINIPVNFKSRPAKEPAIRVNGQHNQVSEIQRSYTFKKPVIFAVNGGSFRDNYSIRKLFYYPEIVFSHPQERGHLFYFSQGYHLGMEKFEVQVFGFSPNYKWNIIRKTEFLPISDVCTEGIKNFNFFGRFMPSQDGYFAIAPTLWRAEFVGKNELKQLLENGLNGIVFKIDSGRQPSAVISEKEMIEDNTGRLESKVPIDIQEQPVVKSSTTQQTLADKKDLEYLIGRWIATIGSKGKVRYWEMLVTEGGRFIKSIDRGNGSHCAQKGTVTITQDAITYNYDENGCNRSYMGKTDTRSFVARTLNEFAEQQPGIVEVIWRRSMK